MSTAAACARAEAPPSQTVYLTRTLDRSLEEAEYTLLLDASLPASVVLDGELLYTTAPGSGQAVGAVAFPAGPSGPAAPGESVRCTLPRG